MSEQPPIRIKHLFISPGHNFLGHHGQAPSEHPVIECAEVRCLAGRGLERDRFCDYKGDYAGQITFFAHEVYEEICGVLDVWDKPASVFRRNVVTEGLADLNVLIGRKFEVQGVRFLATGEAKPCYWMDRSFGPGAENALHRRGGLRAKILTDGILRLSPRIPS